MRMRITRAVVSRFLPNIGAASVRLIVTPRRNIIGPERLRCTCPHSGGHSICYSGCAERPESICPAITRQCQFGTQRELTCKPTSRERRITRVIYASRRERATEWVRTVEKGCATFL